MNKFVAYILTGLFFSFPLLSPAQSVTATPAMQLVYLLQLQTNEDKHKATGSNNSNQDLNQLRTSGKKTGKISGIKTTARKVTSVIKSIWDNSILTGKTASEQRSAYGTRSAPYHKYNSLVNLRSVVLRI